MIVAFAVTESNVSDSEVFEELFKSLPPRSKIYGDKAYSSRKNHKIAKEKGITLISPPKKNFSTRRRARELQQKVRLLKKYGYKHWSRITGYFRRFAMEWVFSSFKRLFGERTRAKIVKASFATVMSAVMLFNTIAFPTVNTNPSG